MSASYQAVRPEVTGRPAAIVKLSDAVPVPVALVALSVTDVVPLVEGMPEITPVLVLTLRPSGSPVAAKLVGLLLAVIV